MAAGHCPDGGMKIEGWVKMVERSGKDRGGDGKMGRIGNRPFWVLSVSIIVRAIHLMGAAVVLTTFVQGGMIRPPAFYTGIAFGSGMILLFTEWLRHRQIYRELAGMATFVKVLLLGAVYHGVLPMRETVLLVFFLAAVAAHVPKLVRHRLLF